MTISHKCRSDTNGEPYPPRDMPRLFKNGRIFTSVEGDSDLYEAIVIDNDKVVYVGSDADAEAKAVGCALTTCGGS